MAGTHWFGFRMNSGSLCPLWMQIVVIPSGSWDLKVPSLVYEQIIIILSFENCVPLIESYDMDNVFEELMSVHDIRFKCWQINIKTNWLIFTDCSGEIQVQNPGLFLTKREHDVSESDNEFAACRWLAKEVAAIYTPSFQAALWWHKLHICCAHLSGTAALLMAIQCHRHKVNERGRVSSCKSDRALQAC